MSTRSPWITDFGLAKLTGRDDLTNSGDMVGTLRYLAPEALEGQTDHRGDIYSLGLTLYELLDPPAALRRPEPQRAVAVRDRGAAGPAAEARPDRSRATSRRSS